MIYGFNKETKQCLWTADGEVVIPEGVVAVNSDDVYVITEIELGQHETGEYYIAPITVTDEMRIQQLQGERLASLQFAKQQIELLADLKEFSTKSDYEALYKQWRKYRVELYEMEITDPNNVKWPKRPQSVDM